MMKTVMVLVACIFSASAALAQVADPAKLGQAIGEGVDKRVDARVDQRLSQLEVTRPAQQNAAARNDRLATIETECQDFRSNSAYDKEVLMKRYSKFTDAEFKTAVRDCQDPTWREKEHNRKLSGLQIAEGSDDQVSVKLVAYRPGYPQRGGAPRCPPSFHFDRTERSCIRHTAVSGPSPYNVPDDIARCRPGSIRNITVRSPTGGRRVVKQVCNVPP